MRTLRRNLELVESQLPDGEAAAGVGLIDDPRLSHSDVEAARELAASHLEIAARLDPDSRLRGLMLRTGGHWSRLGGLPKGFLHRA